MARRRDCRRMAADGQWGAELVPKLKGSPFATRGGAERRAEAL